MVTFARHSTAAFFGSILTTGVAPAALPGAFRDTGQRFGTLHHLSISLADLDSDGDLDAWIGNYLQPSTLWMNDGIGFFTHHAQVGFALSGRVLLEDFNQDGRVDAFVVSHGVDTALWLNVGAGNFARSPQSFGSAGEHAAAAGDLDGDGDVDMMAADLLGRRNFPLYNDGNGFFTPGETSTLGQATELRLGDLDDDGDLDAMLAYSGLMDSPKRVLLNDGAGRFNDSGVRIGSEFTTGLALGDLDGDGDLDMFSANSASSNHDPADTVWLNNGNGVWVDCGQRLGNGNGRNVVLADFDADGDLDALVTNISAPNEIWMNDGAGQFLANRLLLGGNEFDSQSAVGDLDGDGDLDVVTAVAGGNRVYRNFSPQRRAPPQP